MADDRSAEKKVDGIPISIFSGTLRKKEKSGQISAIARMIQPG